MSLPTRRALLALGAGGALALLGGGLRAIFGGGGRGPGGRGAPPLGRRIDDAIARGAARVMATQSPDGAFRESAYGALRDGASLTPIAAKALAYLPDVPGAPEGARRAAAWLASLVGPGGRILEGDLGLGYPVYTAALSVMALTHLGREHAAARDGWAAFLRSQQYGAAQGWREDDPGAGGWGYGRVRPRPAGPLAPVGGEGLPGAPANLSATLFALGALRASGAAAADPAVRAALRFVLSCRGEDGGFHASPIDEALCKAGRDPGGALRSYGSATADGLRALLACGLAPEEEAPRAARAWLLARFAADRQAGDFAPERAPLRDGYYLYYAWSVAHALVRARSPGPWAAALAEALLARQGADGAWRSAVTDGHEDDPVIGTCLALGALANARLAPG